LYVFTLRTSFHLRVISILDNNSLYHALSSVGISHRSCSLLPSLQYLDLQTIDVIACRPPLSTCQWHLLWRYVTDCQPILHDSTPQIIFAENETTRATSCDHTASVTCPSRSSQPQPRPAPSTAARHVWPDTLAQPRSGPATHAAHHTGV